VPYPGKQIASIWIS